MQDLMGGDISKMKLSDGDSHNFNLINGNVYDITSDKFDESPNYSKYETVKKSYLLSNSGKLSRGDIGAVNPKPYI
jgi:hypothetical protein